MKLQKVQKSEKKVISSIKIYARPFTSRKITQLLRNLLARNVFLNHMRIQNPVKHLIRSVSRK